MADVKERPILFSAPMVRALLDGRKTQTRRVMKPQPHQYVREFMLLDSLAEFKPVVGGPSNLFELPEMAKGSPTIKCPHGKPGDRLWVKESYVLQCDVEGEYPPHSDGRPIQRPSAEEEEYANWSWSQPHYRATDPTPELVCTKKSHKKCDVCIDPWRNSLFMPRWASRITLEITDVRVERLQDISGEDSEAEGVFNHIAGHSVAKVFRAARGFMAIQYYRELWESINGAGSWDANPWVWALTFRRLDAAAGKVAVA